VPGTGPISNLEIDLITKWESNSKDIPSEQNSALNPQIYEQLFNILAEWNIYLESHIPYFSEDRTKPEEPQL